MGVGREAAKAFPLRAAGLCSAWGGFAARLPLGRGAEEGQPCPETSRRVCSFHTHQPLTDSRKEPTASSIKSLLLAQAENPLKELMQGKKKLREEGGGACD